MRTLPAADPIKFTVDKSKLKAKIEAEAPKFVSNGAMGAPIKSNGMLSGTSTLSGSTSSIASSITSSEASNEHVYIKCLDKNNENLFNKTM